MPITIVRLDKPFWVVCGDSRVRVQPSAQGEDVRAELRAAVIGWENVQDQDGVDVPFSVALIERLPWAILVRVLRCLRGVDDPLADRSGTILTPSSGESNGNPATPA